MPKSPKATSGNGDSRSRSGINADVLLRAVVDSAFDAIISKDLGGNITTWNKAAESIFGYTADEVIGKSIRILIPSELQSEEDTILNQIRSGGSIDRFETVRLRKDGLPVKISLTVSPVISAEGEIVGISKIARDITEFRETQGRLQLIANSLPVLIAYIDTDHCYRFVNNTYSDWFGMGKGSFVGRKVPEVIGQDGYKIVRKYVEAALAGQRVSFEQEIPYPGGRKRFVHADYVPDVEPITRRVKGMVGLVQDITDRKRTEEALRESESRFRMALASGSVTVYEHDAELRYKWVYPPGPYRDDVLGKTDIDLNPGEEGQFRYDLKKQVLETGQPAHSNVSAEVKGETRWYELIVHPRRDSQGQIIGVGGTAFDITDRLHAEEAVLSTLESIGDGFFALDADWRFVYVNSPAERILDIDRETVLGQSHWDVFPLTLGTAVEAEYQRAAGGEVRDFENYYEPWDRWFHNRCFPRKAGGISVYFEDITEKKKTEIRMEDLLRSEREAREQAEETIRLRDEFLTTVSHELRTPLNSIIGWSGMLASGMPNLDEKHAAQTIFRNAKAQAQLIDDILDVSRVITGKIRLNPKPVAVGPVIEQAVETLRPAIDARNISVNISYEQANAIVNADPDRLQQIVWNLISNAIKFTNEGGTVDLSVEARGGMVQIVVADSGIGIKPEFLPFVFERFRQADGSSTRKHGGIGLGLAIVRHLVELHGGSVSVTSEGEGKGATFVASFPANSTLSHETKVILPDDSLAFVRGEAESLLKGLKVLVVDDQKDSLELLTVLLTGKGAEVTAVDNVQAALEAVRSSKPDIVVSDIAMPGEDGYSLIEQLRSLSPDQGGVVPAIALTAYVASKEEERVLASGFQKYLAKPVIPSQLIKAIAALVANN